MYSTQQSWRFKQYIYNTYMDTKGDGRKTNGHPKFNTPLYLEILPPLNIFFLKKKSALPSAHFSEKMKKNVKNDQKMRRKSPKMHIGEFC